MSQHNQSDRNLRASSFEEGRIDVGDQRARQDKQQAKKNWPVDNPSFGLSTGFSREIEIFRPIDSCTGQKIENMYCKIFLNQWKIPITREKIFKLKSFLYLMLGSCCSGGKWILYSVDWVNVSVFWKSSLQTMDRVAQFLSNKISKRFEAKTNLYSVSC